MPSSIARHHREVNQSLILNWHTFGETSLDKEAMLSSIPRNATEETMLYRFACLDAHDNAASTEEIDARSLIDAIAKAHMMLKSRPHHETVEVWLGNSLAYHARKNRAAA